MLRGKTRHSNSIKEKQKLLGGRSFFKKGSPILRLRDKRLSNAQVTPFGIKKNSSRMTSKKSDKHVTKVWQ